MQDSKDGITYRAFAYIVDNQSIKDILAPGYFPKVSEDKLVEPGSKIVIYAKEGCFETIVESVDPVVIKVVYSKLYKDESIISIVTE